MNDPSVIDLSAWRAKRGLSPQKNVTALSVPSRSLTQFAERSASTALGTSTAPQASKYNPSHTLPIFLAEEVAFFAPAEGQSRTLLISAICLFALLIAGDVFDKIPHGLGWVGIFGALILGFILWASRNEDAGGRPQLALSEAGLALDPKGQRRDIGWNAIVNVHAKGEGLDQKILITIGFSATSCQGCRPQAQTLELSANLQSADGQTFADLFLRMARARCLGAHISV